MPHGLRRRFWLETAPGSITGCLAIVTLFWHDWIEAVFGVDPDRGNGSAEWLIVADASLTRDDHAAAPAGERPGQRRFQRPDLGPPPHQDRAQHIPHDSSLPHRRQRRSVITRPTPAPGRLDEPGLRHGQGLPGGVAPAAPRAARRRLARVRGGRVKGRRRLPIREPPRTCTSQPR